MNTDNLIPASEICKHHGIDNELIESFQKHNLIDLIWIDSENYLDLAELPKLEKILQFHNELQVKLEDIEGIVNLLDRLRSIQKEVNQYKKKLLAYQE